MSSIKSKQLLYPLSGSFTGSFSGSFLGNIIGTASVASNAISSSYAYTASSAISSSYAYTASSAIIASASLIATSASYAFTASSTINAFSASYSQTSSFANTFTVAGTLTAQTLVVTTISSSVEYSSGSNIFGNSLTNTQVFTGSVSITGSLSVNNISVLLSNQTSSISVLSASYAYTASSAISSSLSQTASYVLNAVSSSYSYTASSAISSSFANSSSVTYSGTGSFTGSFVGVYTGSLFGTSSQAISSSYAYTASSAVSAYTASSAIFASASLIATSASYAFTASSAISSSYASTASASIIAISSSYSYTASSAVSSSYVLNAVSSSYASTASYSLSGNGFPFSGSAVITGSLLVSSSLGVTGSVSINGFSSFYGSISGSQPITNPSSSIVLISGSILPNSGSTSGGSSVLVNTALSASANGQTLVGLEILPAYNTGSFTGILKYGLKVEGIYLGQVTAPSNYNIAIGSNNSNGNGFTLQNLTSGVRNIAIGGYAGGQITTGTDNTIIGYNAGVQRTYAGAGSSNVIVGNNAGFYGQANNTVVIGYNAINNSNVSDGVVAIGANITLGSGVGVAQNNIIIGNSASTTGISGGNQIAIGASAVGLGVNTTVIGNSSTTTSAIRGNLILGSLTGSNYLLDSAGTSRLQGLTGFNTINPPSSVVATPVTSSGNLADGTYYYKLVSIDALGNTSLPSAEVSASISGSSGSGSVNLTWTYPNYATAIRVYQGTNSGSENKYFTSPGFTSFTDTGSAGTAGSVPTSNNTVVSYINTSNQFILGAYGTGQNQGGGFAFSPNGTAGGVNFNTQGIYGRIWSNPQGTVQNTYDQPSSVGFVAIFAGGSVWYGTMNSNGGAVKYNASITGANKDHIWYTNFNEQMRLFSSTGNLGVGVGGSDAGYRLDVNGTARIQAGLIVSGSTTLTGSFNLIGNEIISGSSTATGGYTGSLFGTASQATSASYAYTASSAINASSSLTAISASYAANSTTASYALTASYLNPLSQSVIITGSITGSGDMLLGGSLGIGSTSLTGYNLHIGKNITGAVTAYGIMQDGVIQSDVTTIFYFNRTLAQTQAAAFTLPNLTHYFASQGTFGAGSTVTNQTGFHVASTLSGATTNYGFRGQLASSGSNNYNLYMDGTAPNYLAGSLGIGYNGAALPYNNLFISKNLGGSIDSVHVNVNGVIQSDVTNSAIYYRSSVSTAAASFTLTTLQHYIANQGTIGAGSVVTNQYGFTAANTLSGATNNYGFYGNLATSGSANWNLYMNGTAPNYLAGSTTIANNLNITGSLLTTGSFTLIGNQIISGSSTATLGYTGSLLGTASYAAQTLTASYANNATTSSYAVVATTASYAQIFNIGGAQMQYATATNPGNTNTNIFTTATGSFTSAFYNYTVYSGSNARSGHIMAVWTPNTSPSYTEYSTVDIGSTLAVTASFAIVTGAAQFNITVNTTGTWAIKGTVTYI